MRHTGRVSRRALMIGDHRIHIASLVVQALPARAEAVREILNAFSDAEVLPADPTGKIVATLECTDERRIARCMDELQSTAGVLVVSLVSHFIEENGMERPA